MISKAPGVVGCAHCKRPGATEPCPACHMLVCPACLRDPASCDVPHARELRLGATARLRRLSEDARYGVVSRWRRAPRLADLAAAVYVRDLPTVELSKTIGAVTREGRYLWVDKPPDSRDEFAPTEVLSIGKSDAEPKRESRASLSRYAPFELCRGERMLFSASLEAGTVRLADLDADSLRVLHPLPPNEIMQTCTVAPEAGLLFTATYGHVHVHRIVAGGLKKVGTLEVADADIGWLGFARGRIAIVSGSAHQPFAVTIHELGDRWAGWQKVCEINRFTPQRNPMGDPRERVVAALSADARFFAMALEDRTVMVHDLESDTRASYAGHTDDVCLIGFGDAANVLVTADRDNRVRIRPRSGRHFLDTFPPSQKLRAQ